MDQLSVNVGQPTAGDGERLISIARRTNTEQRDSWEITVVGELPFAIAKRIVDAVVFKAQT